MCGIFLIYQNDAEKIEPTFFVDLLGTVFKVVWNTWINPMNCVIFY